MPCSVKLVASGSAVISTTNYAIVCDRLGSPTIVFDATGAVAARYAYDAWGHRVDPSTLVAPADYVNPLPWMTKGFTGHEMLDELNLINMVNRVYDPAIGRFLSRDAYYEGVTSAMAFNPFTYCRNSPLVFTDPDGNLIFLIPIIVGAVIGAYMGGTLANNGNLNPFQWNYNAKTFGYMALGGLIGGASTGIGLAAASGASAGMTAMGFASGSILNMAVTGAVGAGMTALWNSAGMQALAGVNDPGKVFSSVGFAALTGGLLGALGGLGGLDPGAFNPKTATPFQQALMGSALAAGTTGASALGQAAAQAFSPVAKTVNDAGNKLTWEDKMKNQYFKGYDNGAVCYDDDTFGKNLFKANYPGSHNPKGLDADGNAVDVYAPRQGATFLDYPGFFHDIAYDKLGIRGPLGLFTSLKSLPADMKFVGQSMYLGTKNLFSNTKLALESYVCGIGLGICTVPKALIIPTAAFILYQYSK